MRPAIKVYKLIILIIIKLFKPVYLKISNSFLSIREIKKTCVDNKKIKVESLEPINIEEAVYSCEFGKSLRTSCLTQISTSNKMQLIISW